MRRTIKEHWDLMYTGTKYTNKLDTDIFYDFDNDTKILHIGFQHSQGHKDWLRNFMLSLRMKKHSPYAKHNGTFNDKPDTYYVHHGYLEAHMNIREFIFDLIEKYNPKEIVLAGYSHGGPLTFLMYKELKEYGYTDDQLDACTYGCPRFVSWFRGKRFKESVKSVGRTVLGYDLITKAPWPVMGYMHVGELIKIKEGSNFIKEVLAIVKTYIFKQDDHFDEISHGYYGKYFRTEYPETK